MAHCKSLGQARLIFNNEIPIILLLCRLLQKYCSNQMSIRMKISELKKYKQKNQNFSYGFLNENSVKTNCWYLDINKTLVYSLVLCFKRGDWCQKIISKP